MNNNNDDGDDDGDDDDDDDDDDDNQSIVTTSKLVCPQGEKGRSVSDNINIRILPAGHFQYKTEQITLYSLYSNTSDKASALYPHKLKMRRD